MKDQYFGDVGDYGKYGLLRFLAQHGISIAVNWYLTEDDGSNDGKHITYLGKKEFWKYDPDLYRHLKEYVIVQKKREVSLMETSGLISDSKYYRELIEDPSGSVKSEREAARSAWHKKALEACAGADLVFLDPDNGFRASLPKAVKDQMKYCYSGEVRDHYDSGADVVFYTTRGRRTEEQWALAKRQMQEAVPDAVLMALTFHRGTQRSYVFAIHPDHKEKYEHFLDAFLHTDWKDMFTREIMS